MIGGIRSILCVSVFQGLMLVIVIMIDYSERKQRHLKFSVLVFLKSLLSFTRSLVSGLQLNRDKHVRLTLRFANCIIRKCDKL